MGKQRAPEKTRESLEKVKTLRLFTFIKGLHKNAKYFDPDESKVDEDVLESILSESNFATVREELLTIFQTLHDLLESSSSLADFVENGQKKIQESRTTLDENLQKISSHTDKLFKPLSELDLYYRNSGLVEIPNLTVIALNEALWENDPGDEIYKSLAAEINPRHRAVDKSQSVGYVVMPKFPGGPLLDRFAGLCQEAKCTMLVGYRDLPNVEATLDFIEKDKIGGPNAKWGNIVVIANTAMTKDGYRLSPVSAVAGKLHITRLSQPIAGLEYGSLAIDGLRYNVTQDEVTLFKKNGVIPLLNAFNADMSFGTWTAFKGDNLEIQQYAVRRVLNWISRSLCHNLNKCTHNISEPEKLKRINTQLADFLKQAENNRIILKGNISKFRQDRVMPDKIDIDIDVQPLWAIRLFALTLKAQKNSDVELTEN